MIEAIRCGDLFFGYDYYPIQEGWAMAQREKHEKVVHQSAIKAYVRWWEKMEGMKDRERMAYFYKVSPLDGTNMGFLLRVPSSGELEASDFFQFALNDAANETSSGSIGDVNTTTTAPAGFVFQSRIGNTNGGSGSTDSFAYSLDTTYLLVGKISKTNSTGTNLTTYDRMDLFVNPVSRDVRTCSCQP